MKALKWVLVLQWSQVLPWPQSAILATLPRALRYVPVLVVEISSESQGKQKGTHTTHTTDCCIGVINSVNMSSYTPQGEKERKGGEG